MRAFRFTSRLIILVAIILVALAPVSVASATPPVIENGIFDDDYKIEFQPCPGIEVWDHEVLTYRQTAYFDDQGNVTRVKIHFIGTDTFHTPQNPGVELSGHFTATTEIDLQTGEFIHASGVPIKITVPGYGAVLVREGFWKRYPNDHQGGKDSFADPDDLAVFCSLLAGN